MAKSYLDSNGLLYFWGKIKSYVTNLLAGKQDTIDDLSDIRSGAAKGATAVQTETDPVYSASPAAGITSADITNWNNKTDTKGTVTKVKMNGTEKAPNASGVVDLGTVITAHQDISGKADKSEMSVSESGDSTTITLKEGTSATVLKEHQDISGKADKSATVSNVDYNTTSKKITKTINGKTTDVVTAAKIVEDGGGITDISGKVDKTTTVNGHALSGNVTVTKSDVSLGNVTNDAQVKRTEMGAANGVATLDGNGKVPSSQLPSYVDDVIEAYARSGQTALSANWLATGSATGTVITPEAGKIYVLMADTTDYAANTQFRWSGTSYVKLNDGGVSAITNAEIDTIVAS